MSSGRVAVRIAAASIGVAPADAAALLGHSVEVHLAVYLPHSGAAGIQAAARALGRAAQQQREAASGV